MRRSLPARARDLQLALSVRSQLEPDQLVQAATALSPDGIGLIETCAPVLGLHVLLTLLDAGNGSGDFLTHHLTFEGLRPHYRGIGFVRSRGRTVVLSRLILNCRPKTGLPCKNPVLYRTRRVGRVCVSRHLRRERSAGGQGSRDRRLTQRRSHRASRMSSLPLWFTRHLSTSAEERIQLAAIGNFCVRRLEQFQQKCEAVLRPELRKNKEIEHFRDSEKSGNALELRVERPI